MSWSLIAVPSLALTLVVVPSLGAQSTDSVSQAPSPPAALQPATSPSVPRTVRLTIASPDGRSIRVTGLLTAQDQDSMVLHLPDVGHSLSVSRADVRRVEVAVGRGSQTGEGALKGFAIGTGVGLILGVAANASESSGPYSNSDPAAIPAVALGGALWGLVIGVIAGSLSHKTIWADQGRLTVSPGSASVSFAF